MKIYGTQLPGTMDAIIKNAIAEHGFTSRKELMKHFRQRVGANEPLFLVLLAQALPDWRSLTSARDPDRYMMHSKLVYRVKKYLD